MRWLVVGGGSIGRRHLANLLALDAGDVELCEPDASRREALTQALRVRAHARLEDALARRPEAVLVCTPTHQHLPAALAAAQAGAHLFIEKPVAASLDGTETLLAALRAQGRTGLVACNMRFHPGVAALKSALDAGRLTRPLIFRAWFSHYLPNWRPGQDYRQSYSARRDQGGGIILEGLHELDYLRWMAGEVAAIQACADHVSELEIDSEDVALVMLQFEAGAVGEIRLDYLSPCKLRGCEVIGTGGVLRWESRGKRPEQVVVQGYDASSGRWTDLERREAYDGNEMYLEELKHFIACVEGRAQPLLSLEDACRLLALALTARDHAAPYDVARIGERR
ncbi:MAG: Gfo/Idh/MocA family oxidoreductase [Candidatus Omnitrophica bacterium]|nr:Gfo/Idh/MocA family oxidoreductase [Candidatus Omnitrophota bacterium]